MTVAGIDGCPAGWVLIKYGKHGYFSGVYRTINKLIEENPDIVCAFIDMPIGLSSVGYPRTIEQKLRAELKPRHSTVFNPPCRIAVYQDDLQKAKALNIEVEGKSLSIQTLNITPKIRELDLFLKRPQKTLLIESHPELCFKYLNNGKVVLTKKSTIKGQMDRIKILSQYVANVRDFVQEIIDSNNRKKVKPDDIIDAMCLCVSLKLAGQNGIRFLRDQNLKDENQIEIKIGYFGNQE